MAGPSQQTTKGFLDEVTNILVGGTADPGLAVYYLDALFGNWVSGAGNEYTLITSSFVVINFLAFGLGVVIFFAAMLGGVMKTALRGEIMGKEWGSDTLPIKMFVGIACMMPIFVDANVSISQRFGMNMMLTGSAAGDYTWRKVLDNATMNIPNTKYTPNLEMASSKVLESAICAIAFANENGLKDTPIMTVVYSDASPNLSVQYKVVNGYRNTSSKTKNVYTEAGSGSVDPAKTYKRVNDVLKSYKEFDSVLFGAGGGCGSYTLSDGQKLKTYAVNKDFSRRISEAKTGIFLAAYPAVGTLISNSYKEAAIAINNGYSFYIDAKKGRQSNVIQVKAQAARVNANTERFIQSVNKLAQVEYSKTDKSSNGGSWQESLTGPAKEAGWLYAGAWIMQLGEIIRVLPDSIENLTKASTAKPSSICTGWFSSFFGSKDEDCDGAKDIENIHGIISSFMNTKNESKVSGAIRSINECSADERCSPKELERSFTAGISEGILKLIYMTGHINSSKTSSQGNGQYIIGTDSDDMKRFKIDQNTKTPFTDATGRQNPFAVMSTLGHGLMNIGHLVELGMLIPVQSISEATKSISNKIPFLGSGGFYLANLLQALALKLLALASLFMVLGAMLAYVLPILSMVRWLGPALGFLVVAIEFHAVSPLAMMLLLIPEGGGILGTQLMSIIRYLAAVILRPTLCVMGLVGGYVGSYVVFGLYNGIFWTGISLNTNLSMFEVILTVYLYAFLGWQILDKLMALPINLTRDILRWISPGNEPFGDSEFGQISLDPQQLGSIVQADFKSASIISGRDKGSTGK